MLLAIEILGWSLIFIELFGAKTRVGTALEVFSEKFGERPDALQLSAIFVILPLAGFFVVFSDLVGDPLGVSFFTAPQWSRDLRQYALDNNLWGYPGLIAGAAIIFIPIYLIIRVARRHPTGVVSGLGVLCALGSSILQRL